MTARRNKAWQRQVIAHEARLEAIAAFRRRSASRLQAARLYAIGAAVFGELSPAGREAWIRWCSIGRADTFRQLSDAAALEDSRAVQHAYGLRPSADGSTWEPAPYHGPELPPDFPRFVRRI